MPEDRRLAAIMFTDIVGYTALMGSDEDQAFDVLKKNHAIHENLIKKHNGTLIKEIGDGTLASFPLASDAVRCAMEIQKEAKAQEILLKIGIHEGEMVMAGADVLGDGVNIASRLQEASREGCITISGKVYSDIRNKAGIKAKYIGEKKLKNVDDPVKIYEVLCEEEKKQKEGKPLKSKIRNLYYIIVGTVLVLAIVIIWHFLPSIEKRTPSLETLTDKTIAVIPFWNDSPDPDNAYFCSGMEEEIRIHLLKIADLKIESRQSVEKYREDPDIDAITIGKELGVAFIVEGSVQKLEEDIRVRIQLIDAKTGDHIWAETYDGDYTTKLLEFQSNTAKLIAVSLNAVITPEEEQDIDQIPTSDMRAYDFLIRGRNEFGKWWESMDTKHLSLANKLFDKALEIDPQYLAAIGAKSQIFVHKQNYDSAYIYAKRVLEIDPKSSLGFAAMGYYYYYIADPTAAIENYELALKYYQEDNNLFKSEIENLLGLLLCRFKNDYQTGLKYIQYSINDRDSITYHHYGYLGLIFLDLGDYKKAKTYMNKLLEGTGSLSCWGISNISSTLNAQGKFNDAITFLDSICSITLCESGCYRHLFWTYLFLEQYDEAEKYFKKYVDAGPSSWKRTSFFDTIFLAYIYKETGKNHEAGMLLRNLQKSLKKEVSQSINWWTYLDLSIVHALFEEKEESMKYLSDAIGLGLKWGWHDFLPKCPLYKNYWDDPDFIALVKQAQEEIATKRKQVQEMIERGEINF